MPPLNVQLGVFRAHNNKKLEVVFCPEQAQDQPTTQTTGSIFINDGLFDYRKGSNPTKKELNHVIPIGNTKIFSILNT